MPAHFRDFEWEKELKEWKKQRKKATTKQQPTVYARHRYVFFVWANTNSIIVAIVVLYAIIEFRFVQLSALVSIFSPRHITRFLLLLHFWLFHSLLFDLVCIAFRLGFSAVHKFAGAVFSLLMKQCQYLSKRTNKQIQNWIGVGLTHASTIAFSLFVENSGPLFVISLCGCRNYRNCNSNQCCNWLSNFSFGQIDILSICIRI